MSDNIWSIKGRIFDEITNIRSQTAYLIVANMLLNTFIFGCVGWIFFGAQLQMLPCHLSKYEYFCVGMFFCGVYAYDVLYK